MWPIYGALLKRYAHDLPPLLSTLYFLFYTALTLLVLHRLGAPLLQDLHRAHAFPAWLAQGLTVASRGSHA